MRATCLSAMLGLAVAACGTSPTQVAATIEDLQVATQAAVLAESPQSTPTPSAIPVQSVPHAPTPQAIERFTVGESAVITYIQMLDPAAGWAIAGEESVDDHILRTNDGGATWRDVTPPEPQARAQQPLKSAAVYFLDADTAWATYYPYDLTKASIIWRTDDGGKSWERSTALDWRDK